MKRRYEEWSKQSRRRIVQAFCGIFIVGTAILAAAVGRLRWSLPFFTVEQTIAASSVCSSVVFWVLLLPFSSALDVGSLAFLRRLYSENRSIVERDDYRERLLAKLDSGRETCSTLASLATSIIGIIVAVSTVAGVTSGGSQILLFGTTLLLIVSTLLLMHGVDLYDTAVNPGIPAAFLEKIRRGGVFYYSWGLFCLVTSIILGVALINPYLTLCASIAFMLAAARYLFVWESAE